VGRVEQVAAGVAERLELRGRVVRIGVAPPGHRAQGQPGHGEPAAAQRSLLHATHPTGQRSPDNGTGYPESARAGDGYDPAEAPMRLGLDLNYLTAGVTPADVLAQAREADRLGYDSLWVAEAYGSDTPTMLAWLAGQTERIDLGSAVMQIPARTPAMTAMTAVTLDTLSGGRFRLGLGVSGPQVSEGWHGVRFSKPLARTREYVDIVKL